MRAAVFARAISGKYIVGLLRVSETIRSSVREDDVALGKCPKCDKEMPYINGGTIKIKRQQHPKPYRGVVYSCPNCSVILSVQIDPQSLNNFLLSENEAM
jgi:hypothetical protein